MPLRNAYLANRNNRFVVFLLISLFSFSGWTQDCDLTTRNMIKYLGTTSEDRGSVVAELGADGYILGGSKVSGTNHYLYLARLDICGEVLWEKVYSEGTYGFPSGVIRDGDFIYVSSYYGSPRQTTLIKLDLNGNILDSRKFGANQTYPRRMIQLADDNLIYCGATNAPGGPGMNDFYVTKSTLDGTVLWNKQFGGTANDFGHNISETADGSLLSVGYTRDYLPGIRRGLTMKLDDAGNIIWSKEYHNGDDYTNFFYSAEIDGFYYFTGRSDNGTTGGYDGLIVKTTTDGDIVWSKFYGTTGNDMLLNLFEKDGDIYVSGVATSPTMGDEVIVMRIDDAGNLLEMTSLGTADNEYGSGAFLNFNSEADGFFGITSGNTGLIGNKDVIFYRFNSIADNCEPSDVELTVIDAGMVTATLTTSSITPSWSFSAIALVPADVPDNHGFICSTIDTLACDSLTVLVSDTVVCEGETITLDATSIHGATVTWDGGITNGIPFTPPVGTTTYTATSDTIADCSYSIEITVVAPPAIAANADNTDICLGESVTLTGSGGATYTWDMGITDGVAHTPLTTGTTTYTVTGTDSDGCTNTDNITITVHELPVANAEFVIGGLSSELGATGTCFENAVQFNSLSSIPPPGTITSWNWNFGDGTTSTDETPEHTFPAAGSYTVTLTVSTAFGCSATHTLTIVMTAIELTTSFTEPTCYGFSDGSITSLVTGATGTITYAITDSDGNLVNAAGASSANGLSTGSYSVTVTDAEGCSATENLFLDQPDSLVPEFSYSPTEPRVGEEITFTDHTDGATGWIWSFGDGTNSAVKNPRHTYSSLGTYTVTLQVTDGSCTGTVLAEITMADELIFYVPNAFTPDGDPYNQYFLPVFTSGYDPYDYHLTIFNRWGEIVFESYNAAYGWDGTYGGGEIVMDGVYIWQIEFADAKTDEKYKRQGHVTILK